MSRLAPSLLLLALLVPSVGCATTSRCGSYGSYDLASCSTGEVRARNPIEHLRHSLNGGGCGDMYWGEFPSRSCDDCNVRPGSAAGLSGLLGVRRYEVSSCSTCQVPSSECGCSDAGHHVHDMDHTDQYEVIESPRVPRTVPRTPSRTSPPQTTPDATTPGRGLPGPDATGASRSIIRTSAPAQRTTRTRVTQ